MGWNKHKVGAWSLRKDACEAVASRGQGKVAARVLGHRSVNGRTMDQVNRADLRCTDLGAFWTGRTAARIGAPLGCLSARRVPKAGGVRSFDDVREGPEREAAAASVEVAEAAEVAAETQRSLEARVGGAGVLDVGRHGGKWKKKACELGAEAEMVALDKARMKLAQAKVAAKKEAMAASQLRLYKEGQAAHAEDRGVAVAMRATHAWAERTEDEAVAFGLDGGDRTYQLAALQMLSPALQGSILAVGALHVLPGRPTWVTRPGNVGSTARLSSSRIHEHVAKLVMEAAASAAKAGSAAKAMRRGWPAEVPLLQRARRVEGAPARQRRASEACVSKISGRRTCFCCSMSHCWAHARMPQQHWQNRRS